MSIIIVGIGTADFSSMDTLDGDGAVLRTQAGVAAESDIVQFVPFHKHHGNGAALAADVLAEFPGQVVHFMRCAALPSPALPSPALPSPALPSPALPVHLFHSGGAAFQHGTAGQEVLCVCYMCVTSRNKASRPAWPAR